MKTIIVCSHCCHVLPDGDLFSIGFHDHCCIPDTTRLAPECHASPFKSSANRVPDFRFSSGEKAFAQLGSFYRFMNEASYRSTYELGGSLRHIRIEVTPFPYSLYVNVYPL